MPRHSLVLTALAIAAIAACGPRPVDSESERLAAREASFLEALSARDADAVASHFAEDAWLHVANMPARQGADAIHQFYGNVFRFLSASAPVTETVRISSSGDMAYSIGRVANTFEGPQGRMEYAGKYLLVWEKRDGEWRIAVYSLSNDQPDQRGDR